MGICRLCGLPDDLCGCTEISKESQVIRVSIERRKWGREVLILSGFDSQIDLDSLAKRLKKKLATGGTAKDGRIELQGNHLYNIRELLVAEGFSEESIEI